MNTNKYDLIVVGGGIDDKQTLLRELKLIIIQKATPKVCL